MEGGNISRHILHKWVCRVNNAKEKAFKAVAQVKGAKKNEIQYCITQNSQTSEMRVSYSGLNYFCAKFWKT